MKKLVHQLPWKQLKKGQGFFIPCLNTEHTRLEIAKEAIGAGVFGKTHIGIFNGRLGVLFVRGHQ
jgi:hypothetical protein